MMTQFRSRPILVLASAILGAGALTAVLGVLAQHAPRQRRLAPDWGPLGAQAQQRGSGVQEENAQDPLLRNRRRVLLDRVQELGAGFDHRLLEGASNEHLAGLLAAAPALEDRFAPRRIACSRKPKERNPLLDDDHAATSEHAPSVVPGYV